MDFRAFLRPFALVAVLSGVAVQRLTTALRLPDDGTWLAYGNWLGMALLTAFAVWASLRAMRQGRFASFQLAFTGGIAAKFFLVAVAVLLYTRVAPSPDFAVAWPVMAGYMPFLVLETVWLSRASARHGGGAERP